MSETRIDGVDQVGREQFLTDLSKFIIEAGQNGWAAGASRLKTPQRPGFKELAYQNGDWQYRDSYAGYYMAPGSSVVYLKEQPVWYMTYGGEGQIAQHLDRAPETYAFLRKALLQPEPELPIRGPKVLRDPESSLLYRFSVDRDNGSSLGDLTDAHWDEFIVEEGPRLADQEWLFSQRGDVGIIVGKDENRKPIYPWDL